MLHGQKVEFFILLLLDNILNIKRALLCIAPSLSVTHKMLLKSID